jgi:RNA polymerase sigma-70 factor (ECF subfamily)
MEDRTADLEAAQNAASGDERAWREIVDHSCHRLFALLLYQVGDREEALDLLQETYVLAFRHMRSYRGEAPIEVWLRGIAIRLALGWKRRWLRRLKMTVPLDPAREHALAAPERPSGELQFQTERRAWENALASLSEAQRAAFLLREWEGWSYPEIARGLRCREATVRVHVGRARARLRRALGRGPLSEWIGLNEGRRS